MKKYARVVQCDARGQLVIPKDARSELNIKPGTGFWAYIIEDEGIFLKIIPAKKLSDHDNAINELDKHASTIKLKKENLTKSIKRYQDQSGKNIKQL